MKREHQPLIMAMILQNLTLKYPQKLKIVMYQEQFCAFVMFHTIASLFLVVSPGCARGGRDKNAAPTAIVGGAGAGIETLSQLLHLRIAHSNHNTITPHMH